MAVGEVAKPHSTTLEEAGEFTVQTNRAAISCMRQRCQVQQLPRRLALAKQEWVAVDKLILQIFTMQAPHLGSSSCNELIDSTDTNIILLADPRSCVSVDARTCYPTGTLQRVRHLSEDGVQECTVRMSQTCLYSKSIELQSFSCSGLEDEREIKALLGDLNCSDCMEGDRSSGVAVLLAC